MVFDRRIKNKLKEKISSFLDLPKDVLLNIEKISILGGECIILENFKQLVEYSENCIKIDTQDGGIDIYGKGFHMNEISREQVKIIGEIEKIEFRQGRG